MNIWLAPPAAFLVMLGISLLLFKGCDFFAAGGQDSPGKARPYACGEDTFEYNLRPNYQQFFPFAFFFTIMHVITLVVTTAPKGVYGMPLLYLLAAVLALRILFGR